MLIPNSSKTCFDYQEKKCYIPNDCPYIEVKSLLRNITAVNGERDSVILNINDSRKKFNVELSVKSFCDLQNLSCELNGLGVYAKSYHAFDLSSILVKQTRDLALQGKIEYYHTKLGWHKVNGQDYFLYDQTDINGIKSNCKRDFLFSEGNLDEYQKMLNEHVFPCKELTLAYILGFSAVVISRINKLRIADLGTIVLNVSGKSSTGKSTIEQLLLSPFGSPVFTKNGLGLPHAGTLNGFLDALEGIHGLPRVIDDLQQNSNINLTELLYTISQEETKMRSGEKWNRNIDGWSGIVIVSSETPLMDFMKVQQGTYPRLLNAANIQWTETAESAEKIKEIVNANYGWTGKSFIDYIVNLPVDDLKDGYKKAVEKVKALMVLKDGLSDRIATRIAAIYLTCELVKQCFDNAFAWTADELITPIIDSEQDTVESRNPAEALLNIIKTYVQENKYTHFDINISSTNVYGKKYSSDLLAKQTKEGCIYIKDNVWMVAIHEARLKKILKTEGFNEWGTASNELKRRGILLGTEEKKKNGKITHRTRRCVNGVWCNVFKFEIPSEQIFEETEERETEQQTTLSQSEMKTDIENWNDDEAMRDFFAEGDENA